MPRAQVEAVDTIRALLDVPAGPHHRLLRRGDDARRGAGDAGSEGGGRTRSRAVTFFTAQVDFEDAGDLKLFLGDETMALAGATDRRDGKGYLDGRVHGGDVQPAARDAT